ncbi:hypothetical protein QNM97_14010 [Gordonia sp. L191]|uniref:DUF7324 family protein n=1 Tax=Gordonia sp. L191 TaxID=2982699 RepID=UPI0024C0413F|nr:hypothetical protein [Gordonia sp. L191]WHU45167.1 hypothetical protein QNM97_14010 [Gordonia sp. L191]
MSIDPIRPGIVPALLGATADRESFPKQEHVDGLRYLLDLISNFSSNDQRARYLLSSNWMRENGAEAADLNAASLAELLRGAFTDHSTPTSCRCGERGPDATGDRAALDAGDGVEGTKPPEGQC